MDFLLRAMVKIDKNFSKMFHLFNLQTIKPADIATVRKLGKPPHLIMRIMDCVLILFQKRVNSVEQDPERPCVRPSWSEALKMMNNSGFLASLLHFSKVKIQLDAACGHTTTK